MIDVIAVGVMMFFAGVYAGSTKRLRVNVWRDAPTPEVEKRFHVSSKRGQLRTDNLIEVSQEIQKLRALGQPYVYRMDGRIVKQEGDRG